MADDLTAEEEKITPPVSETSVTEEVTETPPVEEKKEEEIPVRKSVEQHIIARQKRTIEKLRSKEEPVEEKESLLSDTAQSAVGAEIDRKIAPLVEALTSKYDEDEVKALIADNPEAAAHEKEIKRYMAHPSYKGVPAEVIYHHLAFAKAQKVVEEKRVMADSEAAQMRTAGTSRRGQPRVGKLPTAEEISEMSDEDFEALQHKARTGAFL